MHILAVLVAFWAVCAGAVPLQESRAVPAVDAEDEEASPPPAKYFREFFHLQVDHEK